MDPIAHTLVGACLGETGLRRMSRLAAPTLVIGANLPDIDAVTMLIGSDTSLFLRRGVTHGLLAMVFLPGLLAGAMLLYDRLKPDPAARARAAPLLLLAYLSVWTHPALDWLNTYGVRLLMPFDGRWFYGDSIFILDPWMWLLAGASVVVGHSVVRRSRIAWGTVALLLTAIVWAPSAIPIGAKALWLAGVVGIVLLRVRGTSAGELRLVARACLAVLVIYIASMVTASRVATRQAEKWLSEHDIDATAVMAGPQPANPFARRVVARAGDRYHFVTVDWLATERIREAAPSVAIGTRSEVVEAALAAPSIRGAVNWMRFPTYHVTRVADGYRVVIRDVRYARTGESGFGIAAVDLDASLRPR